MPKLRLQIVERPPLAECKTVDKIKAWIFESFEDWEGSLEQVIADFSSFTQPYVYDATHYSSFTIDSDGELTLMPR